VILAAHGLYWLDPSVALAIALVVAYHALKLVAKVLTALRSAGNPSRVGRSAGEEESNEASGLAPRPSDGSH
jgi:divalent metal cation (Fe/Co/Zn/Cd) transporter